MLMQHTSGALQLAKYLVDAGLLHANVRAPVHCAFTQADMPYYTNQTKYPNTYLSSPLMPVGISLMVGFVIADIFLGVYHVSWGPEHAVTSRDALAVLLDS